MFWPHRVVHWLFKWIVQNYSYATLNLGSGGAHPWITSIPSLFVLLWLQLRTWYQYHLLSWLSSIAPQLFLYIGIFRCLFVFQAVWSYSYLKEPLDCFHRSTGAHTITEAAIFLIKLNYFPQKVLVSAMDRKSVYSTPVSSKIVVPRSCCHSDFLFLGAHQALKAVLPRFSLIWQMIALKIKRTSACCSFPCLRTDREYFG